MEKIATDKNGMPKEGEIESINPSTNFTYSPDVVIKISWLQKRALILDDLREYRMRQSHGSASTQLLSKVHSRVYDLFLDLEPALRRSWQGRKTKNDDWIELVQNINKTDLPNIINSFRKMNFWLDDIGVTKVDTRVKVEYESLTDEIDSENS